MSQFTEDAPETLDDWNAILSNGCCCEMPECPVPTQECEGVVGRASVCLFKNIESGDTEFSFYARFRRDWADGGFLVQWFDTPYLRVYMPESVLVQDCGGQDEDSGLPTTGAVTEAYSEEQAVDDLRAEAVIIMQANLDWADSTDDFCASSFTPEGASTDFNWILTAIFARFRWKIPDTFEGSYFKITWDVAFFPTVGDATAVSTDNTWEWTGPGDPEDADSWKSGWYNIPLPSEPGENRVVNVRFECYHGASFGMLPQVAGEAVEFPP